MKPEKKISLLFLSMALLMTAACTKNHTPAEAPTPVGFRAMSQSVMVKSGNSTALPESVEKFGVWGVSGNDLNIQYLWSPSAFMDVDRQDDDTYKPAADAYWFSNSTHDFLALASDPSTVALPNVTIATTGNPNALNPSMTFTCDLSGRYTEKDYTYDLLGAAARTEVGTAIPTEQALLFWHLFAKIKMDIKFLDVEGNVMSTGAPTLVKVVLKNVNCQGTYMITNAGTTVNPHAVGCSVEDHSKLTDLTFTSAPTLNILPQDISGFELLLDFTRTVLDNNNGTADPSDDVYTEVPVKDFVIDLTPAKKAVETILDSETNTTISPYTFNNQYNWNITISSKNVVNFTVTVNDWQTPEDDKKIPSIEIK